MIFRRNSYSTCPVRAVGPLAPVACGCALCVWSVGGRVPVRCGGLGRGGGVVLQGVYSRREKRGESTFCVLRYGFKKTNLFSFVRLLPLLPLLL